jgi:ribonuclease HI
VAAAEQALLDPRVRADPAAVERLLHPDYVEFGASGRVRDRPSIVRPIAAEPDLSGRVEALTLHQPAPDVVLITYRFTSRSLPDGSDVTGSLRSSVWVCSDDAGWQLGFHHGTPVEPG